MKETCTGSRRTVDGKRHKLKTSTSGHSSAVCPVCKQRLRVRRVIGVMEFPRHTRA